MREFPPTANTGVLLLPTQPVLIFPPRMAGGVLLPEWSQLLTFQEIQTSSHEEGWFGNVRALYNTLPLVLAKTT